MTKSLLRTIMPRLLSPFSLLSVQLYVLSFTSALSSPNRFVVLGGTGKIGTAVAAHLLKRNPSLDVVLVGRRTGDAALADVRQAVGCDSPLKLSFERVDNIWDGGSSLANLLEGAAGVIHTAGPYADQRPTVLDAAIQAQVPVYVDVSDPLPFLEASLERFDAAVQSKTTALCAAGAFPGMSNVLGMEAAGSVKNGDIQDLRFHYFTKGLGGSGTVNLYITNLGFGDPMTQYDQGKPHAFTELSGKLLGDVDFYVPQGDHNEHNNEAKQRVGRKQVFAWPFPEATTVARELNIQGSSSAAMGTAPDIWNGMLGLLVDVVPRSWWRSQRFSKFMADFSQPLVLLTDAVLQQTSPDKVGETHAMRIDVTTTPSTSSSTSTGSTMTSIVQAHESFRQCVGQSCAEFALDAWEHPSPGVFLPEQRYRDADNRRRIIEKLTSTPGTFCYTGPVSISPQQVYPTEVDQVVATARAQEVETQ